jgi:glycosyltransferase involved in cell wall biosynthesis
VGSGPEEAVLRELIAERKLESHVKLLGDLPHEELMARIAAADCFILNTGYEGFSHQLLEVMALGTPIITTPVGGNPELIENGKSGLLVGHNDRAALHSAILALYAEPDRAWAFAAHAQTFAGRFTEKRMIDETIEVFASVLESNKKS